MIPENVQNVLTTGVGHIGTVSQDNKPFHADLLGINSEKETGVVSCCLNKNASLKFLDHVEKTGRISLFVGVISHEAYNLKGRLETLGSTSSIEKEICKKFSVGILELYSQMGMDKNLANKFWGMEPDTALTFSVEKIFIQTPGPDAGKEMSME